ncbi:MAG: hypothetical protein JWR00_3051 [Rubritepida sp.]|nr:hypothetical protein [Rubritepida sp.]
MTSRPRLADLAFLAATLAMVLTLVLPWALAGLAEEQQAVELSAIQPWAILPWAVPEPAAGWPQVPDQPVQLAGQAGAAPTSMAPP